MVEACQQNSDNCLLTFTGNGTDPQMIELMLGLVGGMGWEIGPDFDHEIDSQ